MSKNAHIVQFTHPGIEHTPDKINSNHISWNTTKEHKRKFLLSLGSYVENNELKKGNLVFWGEWEPPSDAQKLTQLDKYYPKWLYKPYLPNSNPPPHASNTDPCVFGDYFRYFFCKQFKQKPTKKPTKLANLDKGSLILFGSTINQNKSDAFFQLDTVFVVSDFIEYNLSDPCALTDQGDYYNYNFKLALNLFKKEPLKLRLYIGASYSSPYEGMYSFSPAKIWNHENHGFPRIALKDMHYITNNLNAAPRITEIKLEDVKDFWKEIVNLTREAGCVEGVKFKYSLKI